jgi:hypothetical protein
MEEDLETEWVKEKRKATKDLKKMLQKIDFLRLGPMERSEKSRYSRSENNSYTCAPVKTTFCCSF